MSITEPTDTREPSFGEKAVGLTFNPSGDPFVTEIKRGYARVIDEMNALRLRTDSPDVKRYASIAITEAQTAQMYAVKAATWRD